MCVSTPSVNTAATKVEAPVNSVEMNATDSSIAMRDSDRQRRLRALSRLQTMQSNSDNGAGKTRLGA